MADIFGRRQLEYGGSFAADDANIRFGSSSKDFAAGVGLVTQNIRFSYQQPITRLYEVGTQLTYFVAGRPQGNASAQRILGPSRVVAAFYRVFGDVCKAKDNVLWFEFNQGCSGPGVGKMTFKLNNVILQGIDVAVSANDMIINEQLSFFFASLVAG